MTLKNHDFGKIRYQDDLFGLDQEDDMWEAEASPVKQVVDRTTVLGLQYKRLPKSG